MTADQVMAALEAAGFCGREVEAGVIYARTAPQAPEFRLEPVAGGWRLILGWNVSAPAQALAEWNARVPQAQMVLQQGETRLEMAFSPDALAQWAALAAEAEAHFIRWRRARRPAEGM